MRGGLAQDRCGRSKAAMKNVKYAGFCNLDTTPLHLPFTRWLLKCGTSPIKRGKNAANTGLPGLCGI